MRRPAAEALARAVSASAASKPARFLLLNPNWNFEKSIYFGCPQPHLALEFGYARDLLAWEGNEALILDAQMENLTADEIRSRAIAFDPHFLVITTAPSYLFWRCPPPELRTPIQTLKDLDDLDCVRVVVGPHGSTTPKASLRKLNADIVILGECEEILPQLLKPWSQLSSVCYWAGGNPWVQGSPHAANIQKLDALEWSAGYLRHHRHHHHRFDTTPTGPGAEVEASRGCPYHCTFCAKDNFRDDYRRRPVPTVLEEIDGLIDAGAEYVYFIDEIFLPNTPLLEGLVKRGIKFGIQTRIDLWSHAAIDLLGRAGCVSIEAGVESITESGREALAKKCKASTQDLASRLKYAKERVPFVQANLIRMENDDTEMVELWREDLQRHGVWANAPVPLFPYPGSPEYTARWGTPDDQAWERAHAYYLNQYQTFSDVQQQVPASLHELEQMNAERC
ncbi:MAG TPA: TIGR04295 family B12-binding domain-containing radical SAM protein [Bryobacteraceae bacterium]|nr:TIGR04295 family B12-binding domain-containing radical SAM protein [Bryobacteraceae bacterium]